ncbi:MAG: sulfotransferase, partial [Myxococcales bacterium]|nr:sulfotransferase [Myxococcales bacterium]
VPLHRRRIETWLRERPRDGFGRHAYTGADFGLSEARLDAEFGPYVERFGIAREEPGA